MPRVPRQVWLVSLAVAVIFIMAAAAPYAAKPTGQRLASGINNPIGPAVVSIGPRALAGWAALVISGLLLLVFLYRRRLFIMLWTLGWGVTGLSMLLASRAYATETLGWLVYGLSQFLGIVSALLFVLSADAYRTRPRFRREYVLILVPLMLWFTLAPLILQAAAVFAPGHLLIAGALLAAGAGHLLLLRQVRMLGAAVTGAGLIALAFVNAWVAITSAVSRCLRRDEVAADQRRALSDHGRRHAAHDVRGHDVRAAPYQPAAGARAGQASPDGDHGSADRLPQSPLLRRDHRARAAAASPLRNPALAAVRRHRSVQGDQRHVRSRRRRRRPASTSRRSCWPTSAKPTTCSAGAATSSWS